MRPGVDADGLVAHLADRHGCTTVLLYGSTARGEDGPESDLDVLGFRDADGHENDTSGFQGRLLDAWIKPVADLRSAVEGGPEAREAFLHVVGGIPLADPEGLLARLLAQVADEAAHPVPIDPNKREFLSSWCRKMVQRARKGDPEGDFRLHWLLTDGLSIAFQFMERRYPGPKAALRILSVEDPELHARFVEALRPGASLAAVERLLDGLDAIGAGSARGGSPTR
jgi:uncharacterized protein